MIYFAKSRAEVVKEFAVAAGAVISAEGNALVAVSSGLVSGVQESAGASGEIFAGFAWSNTLAAASLPNWERFVQAASNSRTLQFTPLGGTLFWWDETANAQMTGGTAVSVSGAVATLPGATVGHTVRVSYRYAPTLAQMQAVQGDAQPGQTAGAQTGQVAVQKSGTIYTTSYDTSVNWQSANPVIKTGASGLLTIGGTGATLTAFVIQVPDVGPLGSSALGIEFQAA